VHRTVDDEFLSQLGYRIWKTPIECLRYYNEERIYETLKAIKGITPREKIAQ